MTNPLAIADRSSPSSFGADDELGMLNHITDETRRAALSLVTTGRVYDLGRVLDEHIPTFPGRYFRQSLVTTAHHVNAGSGEVGENRINWITEIVSATMQVGTHLDALSHLQRGDRAYNGWSVAELAGPTGVTHLGAETIPQIVTRGLLVDVSGARGSSLLRAGDVVTVDDARRALDGMLPSAGDAVLFHTGWGSRWNAPDAYLEGQPGPGLELAGWLVEHGVAVTGCDTWSYGPVPSEGPARPFEVPQKLNVDHGVFVVENLDTSELAGDGVCEFAFVLTHPKVRGATGSWTSPIALA